jgi:membrane-associated phospholipid phosphatase
VKKYLLHPFLLFVALILSHQASFSQDTTRVGSRGRQVRNALIAPVLLTAACAWSVQYKQQVVNWRNENYPNFKTGKDDWIQYVPLVATYTLSFSGVPGKHDLANQTALLCKSAILMTAIFFSLKYTNIETRPDGHDNASWPSGHTEQAFAAASLLQKEYGYKSIWYSIGGYTVATSVGVLRILNNKHYLPDVLIGAAAGILSTNLVYLTHQNRWGKNKTKRKSQAILMPTYFKGPGIYFCLKLK